MSATKFKSENPKNYRSKSTAKASSPNTQNKQKQDTEGDQHNNNNNNDEDDDADEQKNQKTQQSALRMIESMFTDKSKNRFGVVKYVSRLDPEIHCECLVCQYKKIRILEEYYRNLYSRKYKHLFDEMESERIKLQKEIQAYNRENNGEG